MSKKFEQQLKPCPYCGGNGRLKVKRKSYDLTIGKSLKASTSERYIRCDTCHARTQARGKIDNLVNAWNAGAVFPAMSKKQSPGHVRQGRECYNFFIKIEHGGIVP